MTAMAEKLRPPADVLLADGSIAVVRPLRAADGPALHRLHDRVSDDAIRLRFFTAARHAAHVYVDHALADGQTLALVVEQRGRVIGLATAEPVDPRSLRRSPSSSPTTRAGWASARCCWSTWRRSRSPARHYPVRGRRACSRTTRCSPVFADAGYTLTRTPDLGTVVLSLGTSWTDEATTRRPCWSSGPRRAGGRRPRERAA